MEFTMNVIKKHSEVLIHKYYTGVVEYHNGTKLWYFKGKLHREDGPAIKWSNGNKSWFINGVEYSQEEWFERLSEEDKEKAIWNLG
jgi:hypothetical protein